MWAVVVLGILSAVFAWVWFGGRGSQKGSESEETVQDPKPHSGLQSEGGSSVTSNEGESRTAGRDEVSDGDQAHPEEKPSGRHGLLREEAGCSASPAELPEGALSRSGAGEVADAPTVSAGECVHGGHLKGPLAPEEQPVLASHYTAPQQDELQVKPLHVHKEELPETEETMVCHCTAPHDGELQVKPLHAHKEELPETEETMVVHCSALQQEEPQATPLHAHKEELPEIGETMVSHCTAPQQDQLQAKPLHARKEELPETGETMVRHAAALEEVVTSGRPVCGSCSPHRAVDLVPPAQMHESRLVNEESLGNTQENATEHFAEGSSWNILEDVQESQLREECSSLSKLSESVSPKKVDASCENNIEQYVYMKADSPDQSEIGHKLSANQESQDNIAYGHLAATDNVSSQTGHEGLANTQKLEDVLRCQTTNEDTLPYPEENPDLKGASLGEKSCFASQLEARLQDGDLQRTKRVAAVQPMPQNVSLGFKVHYVTNSDSQVVAVTGDHEKLGKWEAYFPLTPEKDGLWSHSITLPGDTNLEWKFVMVENGKIKRWEECNNRCLKTAHEEIAPQQWWGYP